MVVASWTQSSPILGDITIWLSKLSTNYGEDVAYVTSDPTVWDLARSQIENGPWFEPSWDSYCTICNKLRAPMNHSQIARFMGPTWGPPGSCRPQMGPILAPWTLLWGSLIPEERAMEVVYGTKWPDLYMVRTLLPSMPMIISWGWIEEEVL